MGAWNYASEKSEEKERLRKQNIKTSVRSKIKPSTSSNSKIKKRSGGSKIPRRALRSGVVVTRPELTGENELQRG